MEWRKCLAVLLVAVACTALHGVAVAQTDRLGDLQTLFETDPAAGFEQAEALSGAAEAAGDLDQALAVFRVVRGWASQCQHWFALDHIAARIEPPARAAGDWKAVEELLDARVGCAIYTPGYLHNFWGNAQRFVRLFEAATEARRRAGLTPRVSPQQSLYEKLKAMADADPAEHWGKSQPLAPVYLPVIREIERAKADERYGDLRKSVTDLVNQLEHSLQGDGDTQSLTDYMLLAGYVGAHLGWPEGEALVGPFRAMVDRHGDLGGGGMSLEPVMEACARRWTGRDDIYRDTFYWCLSYFDPSHHMPPVSGVGLWCQKLAAFGRENEAEALLSRFVGMAAQRQSGLYCWGVHRLLWAGAPEGLIRQVLELAVRDGREMAAHPPPWYPAPPQTFARQFAEHVASIARFAPEAQRRDWDLRAAAALQDMVLLLADHSAVSVGLGAAAELYDQGGDAKAAEECRALGAAIAANDPEALLQSILLSARSAATGGNWEEVVKDLESTVANQAISAEMLQATLLLCEAHLRLGENTEAGGLMAKARELLDVLPLSPAEKVNYLLALADLCQVPDK